jgi:hypothetical protein
VPGLQALNAGGFDGINAVSCGSAGNCSAGGFYRDAAGNTQAFLVREVNSRWGTAFGVDGLASFTGNGQVNTVSCPSAGNCVAGGHATDGSGNTQAFLVRQANNHWGTAFKVPGLSTLNGGFATVDAVSCASAGNCSAGGFYTTPGFPSTEQVFLVREVNGRWGTAFEVDGTAGLNADGNDNFDAMSCASAGNCAAAGVYRDGSGNTQAFLVNEVNGHWRTAFEVPGLGALNTGGRVQVNAGGVSCGSAGNCSVGGFYTDGNDHSHAFLVRELNGHWGTAFEPDGLATLSEGIDSVTAVSCGSAGNCSAGGAFLDPSGHFQAFLVSQVNSHWGTAFEVPGSGALNAGGFASLNAASCASAGNCSAGGHYVDGVGLIQAFVVAEVNGQWRTAFEMPGSGNLSVGLGGHAQILGMSCASAGSCVATGTYGVSGTTQTFLAAKS